MLHRVFMTCRRVAENATELDEGCMGSFNQLRMRIHLAICRTCARYLKQMQVTKSACESLKTECGMSAEAKAKLLETFRSRKKI